jgi:hypothetical protein
MNTHATKIIEALGDTAEVARLFDVRMPSVSEWKKTGIPKARMMYLKVAHPGALDGVDLEAATAATRFEPTEEAATAPVRGEAQEAQ